MANKTYTVVAGDTLSAIAKKFNTTVAEIHKANASLIKDVNVIRVGWVLNIPVANVSKGCEEIKAQFATALRDVQNLASVKKLFEMLGD